MYGRAISPHYHQVTAGPAVGWFYEELTKMASSGERSAEDDRIVRECLARVLASDPFQDRVDLPKQFLRFVVEETLAGRQDTIKEYSLGTTVFKKGAEFDPQTDNTVRRGAGRVRSKLDEYYNSEQGSLDPIRFVIARGGYVPQFVPWPPPEPREQSLPDGHIPPTWKLRPWLPSMAQFKTWSLPARASYIGLIIGLLSLFYFSFKMRLMIQGQAVRLRSAWVFAAIRGRPASS
jgi:hypothetical protein